MRRGWLEDPQYSINRAKLSFPVSPPAISAAHATRHTASCSAVPLSSSAYWTSGTRPYFEA